MVEKLYYTFENVKDDLMTIIRAMTLDAWIPDVIVGPCRGAYISGVMLSHYYEKPFEGFVWQTRDGDQRDPRRRQLPLRVRRVLLMRLLTTPTGLVQGCG